MRAAARRPQRYYRLQQVDPLFTTKVSSGGITSLKYTGDSPPPEYINGGNLGAALLNYQPAGSATWNPVANRDPEWRGVRFLFREARMPSGTQYTTDYVITNGLPGAFVYESVFTIQAGSDFLDVESHQSDGQADDHR